LLGSAKDVKDLGDTTFDGVSVHHYRLTLDQAKLTQKLQDLPTLKGNAQAQQAFSQILQKGTITLEVWFGKSDHLVRQIVSDARLSFNPSDLVQGLPARGARSEEHTSELQSPYDLVCRLLLEKKKDRSIRTRTQYAC